MSGRGWLASDAIDRLPCSALGQEAAHCFAGRGGVVVLALGDDGGWQWDGEAGWALLVVVRQHRSAAQCSAAQHSTAQHSALCILATGHCAQDSATPSCLFALFIALCLPRCIHKHLHRTAGGSGLVKTCPNCVLAPCLYISQVRERDTAPMLEPRLDSLVSPSG